MYKPRGKPHEASNVALAEQRMALADTIQISSISKKPLFRGFAKANPRGETSTRKIAHIGYSEETELKQQRQHFEAFREVYQERVGGKSVVYEARNKNKTIEKSKSIEPGSLMQEFLTRYGLTKINDVKAPPVHPQKSVKKPPALVRNTIQTVKPQYPLQKLEFGADFVQEHTKSGDISEPRKPILKKKSSKELSTIEAVKELNALEIQFSKADGSAKVVKDTNTSKVYSSGDREELFKQLQATENQISVATTQLQAIQKILQDNKMLTTVEEEDESEDNAKSCQTDEKRQKNEHIKWKVKNTIRGSQNKRTRLVDTLNLLNNRLQNMQDKYFNAPKIKYKTFDEILKASQAQKKNRKGIETIYQNMKYDYGSTMDLGLQPTISSELTQLLHKTDINLKRGKSEPKTHTYTTKGENVEGADDDGATFNHDKSSCTAATTTMTSSMVVANDSKNSGDATLTGTSNLTNDTITSTVSQISSSKKNDVENLKSSSELLIKISAADVLYAPRTKNPTGDGLKYKNIIFDEDYDQDEENYDLCSDNNAGLDKAIEKSIKASSYLMKEFDTLRGDYGVQLDDMLITKAKNVQFSEPHEVVQRVEHVCSPAANRIKTMFSKFDSVLRDSLYSTTATIGKCNHLVKH